MVKQQIVSIQILRGVAACGVVCHHAFLAVTVNRPLDLALPNPLFLRHGALVGFGATGVDIFFVLSGFLMVYISRSYTSGEKSVGHFLIQRLIRVWPLYILITAAACLPLVWNMIHNKVIPYDLHLHRLASFFFVPSFNEAGKLRPILGVGWTLNYEVLFYLCFTLTLLATKKHILLVLTLTLTMLHCVGLSLPHSAVAVFLGNNIMIEFLFGATIGALHLCNRLPYPHPLIWIAFGMLLMFLVIWLKIGAGYRGLFLGIPAAAILIGTLHLEGKVVWPGLILLIGNASYSIYLIHILLIYHLTVPVLSLLSHHHAASIAAETAAAAAIAVAVGIGILCHLFVEIPLLAWGHATYRRWNEPRCLVVKTPVPSS